MSPFRPAVGVDPRIFGRGTRRELELPPQPAASELGNDIKLFATTFLAGFVFVSIYLA
jgi:hypothetical protein